MVIISQMSHQNFQEIGREFDFLYSNALYLLMSNYTWLFILETFTKFMYSLVTEFYEKLFKDLQSQYNCEGVSGLLLLYPKHSVHVIEVSVAAKYAVDLCGPTHFFKTTTL